MTAAQGVSNFIKVVTHYYHTRGRTMTSEVRQPTVAPTPSQFGLDSDYVTLTVIGPIGSTTLERK